MRCRRKLTPVHVTGKIKVIPMHGWERPVVQGIAAAYHTKPQIRIRIFGSEDPKQEQSSFYLHMRCTRLQALCNPCGGNIGSSLYFEVPPLHVYDGLDSSLDQFEHMWRVSSTLRRFSWMDVDVFHFRRFVALGKWDAASAVYLLEKNRTTVHSVA